MPPCSPFTDCDASRPTYTCKKDCIGLADSRLYLRAVGTAVGLSGALHLAASKKYSCESRMHLRNTRNSVMRVCACTSSSQGSAFQLALGAGDGAANTRLTMGCSRVALHTTRQKSVSSPPAQSRRRDSTLHNFCETKGSRTAAFCSEN